MPKVSIILTSFNHAKYLREAIDSALNQTFTDFELIIWDDASIDESWGIIQSYNDSRIKTFRNDEQRRGIYGINKAISEIAQGEYIAIHHSDDVWLPEKLEKQITFLDTHPDVGAVFTNAQAIDEEGNSFPDKNHFYYKIFDQPNRSRYEWLRYFFEKGNALCHPSILIRKQCYDNCGLYRYGLAQIGDLDMWVRLCLKYEIYVLPEKLVRFRVRNNEANTSGQKPETEIRGQYEFYHVLSNYKTIIDRQELVKIFPYASKYESDKLSPEYTLARVALEVKNFRAHEVLGLNIIFDLLNIDSAEKIYKDMSCEYIELTGQQDIYGLNSIRMASLQCKEQIDALTEWAASADTYAKSKVEEARQLKEQIDALTEWATSADIYAKSKEEEVRQLEGEVGSLKDKLELYQRHWIFKVFPQSKPGA
ncbi:glycosyltransferase [Nitrosomonas sp. HPC101]|uniref:glycosyltransferase n=1 Tax=Nitrosomonas sp. HPC101 TaxID=1658667 RepID=UPI00136F6C5B|nr:glycosyltransferase [Nitrosomonas sp. HPC101]MXS84789.1 glycosyltransferase [Nitrosomonas sp. HPC101]